MNHEAFVRSVLQLLKNNALSKAGAYQLLRDLASMEAPRIAVTSDQAIAVVGMAARLPGAASVDAFWRVLLEGEDWIRDLPASRRSDVEAHYAAVGAEDDFLPGPRYWRLGYLDEIDKFDAEYFGIRPAEAAVMDPAHRLFLQVAVEAFESAGHGGPRMRHSRTAVFTGNPGFNYAQAVMSELSATAVTGNLPEFLGSRMAFLYDFNGPVFGIQSTCSSSLVAVHQACQALRAGDCELALVGGATVFSFPGNVRSSPVTASGIVSQDEQCRPFDQSANGIGRGEGVIALVLKPLDRALEAGDHIHAVIRGGAVNNDGACAGLTAPNPLAHTALLKAAWRTAGVNPRDIGYIEAHGTGTHLGDPIEIRGISDAFSAFTSDRQFCAIGSVKGNIGHLLDGVAGLAGLLKAVLIVERGVIPATVHLREPNASINFIESPVYPVDRNVPWDSDGRPRIAGVSSFGFNGTNCHLVIEQAPARPERPSGATGAEVLALSARDAGALGELVDRLRERLLAQPDLALADICFTLCTGRENLSARLAVVASSVREAADLLLAWREGCLAPSGIYTNLPGAPSPDGVDAAHALAKAWVGGEEVKWDAHFKARSCRRVPLPGYPFRRDRHWFLPPARRRSTEAPSTPAALGPGEMQEQMQAIWTELLGPDACDDFFEAGGTSLLATMAVSRVRNRLGVELTVGQFFAAPRLSELVRIVQATLRRASLPPAPLVPVPRDGPLPVSHAQERLWFLQNLNPTSPAYNMPGVVRLKGQLDVEALREALREVVARHESLRTTIVPVSGQPMQVFSEHPGMGLTVEERAPSRAGALEDVRRRAEEEARRPFDLSVGPLMRAVLCRFGGDEAFLLFTTHHIISDGWSQGVLVREVALAYEARRLGRPSAFEPLTLQYADYAVWQRRWLQGPVQQEQLAYWRQRLEGVPALLQLPTDRPRPPVQSFQGAQEAFELSPALTAALRAVGRANGCTIFMTALAAFKVFLARYTRQDDIVVGSPVANRQWQQIEGLIGYFANTLTLRTRLEGNPTFRELLSRVRITVLEAQAHQDLPFERLVAELHPARDLGRHPLFQVNFQLEPSVLAPIRVAGLELSALEVDNRTAKFDLSLSLTESQDALSGFLEYSTDLFDAPTVRRMIGHLVVLFEGVAASPNLPIGTLPMMDAIESRRLLVEWNDTAAPFPQDALVHHLFEAWARATPEAIAVEAADARLTFAELDARADRLAYALQALGVGPEVRVGLLMDRTTEMVVAVLGTLKAGGVYVPLDPASPAQRQRQVLHDAQPRLLLTDKPQITALTGDTHVARPEALWAATPAGARPKTVGSPDCLAYVLYTSGSTGQPKGVMVPHQGVVNYLSFARQRYGLEQGTGAPVHSSLAFDLTITSLLGPLVSGRRVVLTGDADGVEGLAELLQRRPDFSVVKLTPTHLGLLQQLLPREEAAFGARTLVIGGEALRREDVEFWRAHAPGTRLINEYGPTETVVGCCVHEVGAEDPPGESIPIGRPIANTRLYVVDARLNPAPMGVPGELLIGGIGVSRGYLGRPALTAAAFVPDPFGAEPGARLYRTGDLARWREPGVLEFLGRADDQVKVRGHRVELGEVEAALQLHPAIAQAAVVAQKEGATTRLIAFCVPAALGEQERAGIAVEAVARWSKVFEDMYSGPASADATFEIAGWHSSYTREPIPAEQMREWVEASVSRVRDLRPRRALELGCGSGLLLSRLAPECTEYVGTDFSTCALRNLSERVLARDARFSNVRLLEREAADFTGLEHRAYDVVVLNSVVQYFPHAEYLERVLAGAVEATAPGGAIFVGDVRSLPLLRAFHASVQLYQAPAGLTRVELEAQVARRLRDDEELVLSPAFFLALAGRLPRITHVQVLPRAGHGDNEMSNFRYDVVLHVEAPPPPSVEMQWRKGTDVSSLEALRQLLRESKADRLGFAGIPNTRVETAVALAEALRAPLTDPNVEHLRAELSARTRRGFHPEDLAALAVELGFRVELSWALGREDGSLDALFTRGSSTPGASRAFLDRVPADALRGPLEQFANTPIERSSARSLASALRAFARQALPEYMVPAQFHVLDALPLTVNGKVDRRALPTEPGREQQTKVGYVAPATRAEVLLAEVWARVLGLGQVGLHDNFFELGGDSILGIQVVARARDEGLILTSRQIFQHQTLAALAREVLETKDMYSPDVPQQQVQGLVPLTPIQHWFFGLNLAEQDHFNQAVLLEALVPIDARLLQEALDAVVAHHDALRLRYSPAGTGWRQEHDAGATSVPLERVDLAQLTGPEVVHEIERRVDLAQGSLNIGDGPVMRVILFETGPRRAARLFFVIHHLVVDGVSWRVLLEDLQAAYLKLLAGVAPRLAPKTTSFRIWAETLEARAQDPDVRGELDRWVKALEGPVVPLPVERDDGPNDERSTDVVTLTLSAAETRALLRGGAAGQPTQINAPLLTSLLLSLSQWTGSSSLLVSLDGHGREDELGTVDLSRTVGWLTSLVPVRLELGGAKTATELLSQVRGRLEALPRSGIGFGILRYLSHDSAIRERLRALPEPEVAFNYLGQLDNVFGEGLFRNAREATGRWHGARCARPYLFNIDASVLEGQLQVGWTYSRHRHERATTERLVRRYMQALRELIASR